MSSNVKRKVYMDREFFTVKLEETKKNDRKVLFVHVELKGHISTAIVKELKKEFEILKKKIKSAGYANIYSYSATPKFYSLFKGYEDIGPMIWEDKEYRVLKWALN